MKGFIGIMEPQLSKTSKEINVTTPRDFLVCDGGPLCA
jgi:hypothetical protein